MREINNFFYRLDYLRVLCWILILPMAYILIFTYVGLAYIFIVLPITLLVLVGCIFKIPVPKEDDILKVVTENHSAYLNEAVKKYELASDAVMLEGFAPNKKILKRIIGSVSVYPVCRTVVCGKAGEKLYISAKDTPLQNIKTDFEKNFLVSKEQPISLTINKYNEKSRNYELIFSGGNDSFTVYIKQKFQLEDMLKLSSSYFVVHEEV